MSIASQLQAYENGLTDAYNMVSQRGGTMPVHKNMSSLASSIATIPSGGGADLAREVSQSGVYQMPTSAFTFSLPANATDIGDYAMYNAFYYCPGLTAADLSSLVEVNGSNALMNAFQGCVSLTSVDLSSLERANGYSCFGGAFRVCTALTSITLDSLSELLGNAAFSNAFRGCSNLQSISFPALTPTSFGTEYTNQLGNMIMGVSGCTVHFPDGLQTVVQDLNTYPNFGGTNTTVLFDL